MAQQTSPQVASTFLGGQRAYDSWMESLSLPIHRGYYVEDLRALDLRHWAERDCKMASLQLAGQEGVTESKVSEIPHGTTPPPRPLRDGRGRLCRGGPRPHVRLAGRRNSPQTFESELAKRGLTSIMPEQAYPDHGFEWDYEEDN